MPFTIEYLSNFLSGASTVNIGPGGQPKHGGAGSGATGPVDPLAFTFHSRGAGTYKGVFLLRRDDPTKVYSDVRVYEVEVSAVPETVKLELEFETPAGIAVTQDIPITNKSDQPWKITAALSGACFSGQTVNTNPFTGCRR